MAQWQCVVNGIGAARTIRGCKRKYVVRGVSNLRSERFGHHHVNWSAKACAPQTGLKLYAGGKGEEGRNEGANCATRKYWCSKVARGPRSSNGLKRQLLSRLHASFKVKSGARKGKLQIALPPPKKNKTQARVHVSCTGVGQHTKMQARAQTKLHASLKRNTCTRLRAQALRAGLRAG